VLLSREPNRILESVRHSFVAIVLAGLPLSCGDPTLDTRSRRNYGLIEKGPYQSVYDKNGQIERLMYDRNDDRIADAVILYDLDGKVKQAEIDTDLNGVIDRWEYFEMGHLVRLGFSRRVPGVPDYFQPVAITGSNRGTGSRR
jgi:hypothetical protein